MADEDSERKKPEPFPPAAEPEVRDEPVEEPESQLSEEEIEQEAEEAVEDIEEAVDEPKEPPRRVPKPAGPSGPGFVERAWETQYRVESRFKKFGRGKYTRVLKMARKPEKEEYRRASQITAIGIAIVGFIGFLILLFMGWLMGLLDIR